ncbi:hypothetical protein ACFXPS_44015 [Nocardia sp. NPDC059091]|uniref:hypothetical protein n=1 Tax=unclassified Nocardia TaxID=2637762 RepID=UPI0036C22393
MPNHLSRSSIGAALGAAAVGAALVAGSATATAAPLTVEPTSTSAAAATPVGLDTGSAGPGSIICWLLHPSPTCQM